MKGREGAKGGRREGKKEKKEFYLNHITYKNWLKMDAMP